MSSALVLALGLGGCTNTPPQMAGTPAEAAIRGVVSLQQQTSYHVRSSLRLAHLEAPGAQAGAGADNPGNSAASLAAAGVAAAFGAGTAASGEDFAEGMNLFGTFFGRFEASAESTVDLRHQQIEIIPTLSYKAVNAGAFVRAPLLLDIGEQQGYVDISALSPFVVKPENDGKYSSFSLRPVADRIDFRKLLEWHRNVEVDAYRNLPAEGFHDQPLTAADTALGAVRKVEMNASFDAYFDARQQSVLTHKADYLAAVKPQPEGPAAGNPANAIVEIMLKELTKYGTGAADSERKTQAKTLRNGTVRVTFLLDPSGRLLEEIDTISMELPGAQPVNMDVVMQNDYSEMGSARISFTPDANNTVAMTDNMKGTLMEQFSHRAKSAEGPAAGGSAALAPSPFAGTWNADASESCKESYRVVSPGLVQITSAQDSSYSSFYISPVPSARGFYRVARKIIRDNGQADCSGHVWVTDEESVLFIQFNPARTMARLCASESLARCKLFRHEDEAAAPAK